MYKVQKIGNPEYIFGVQEFYFVNGRVEDNKKSV
jgi:hypothetical protein